MGLLVVASHLSLFAALGANHPAGGYHGLCEVEVPNDGFSVKGEVLTWLDVDSVVPVLGEGTFESVVAFL